MAYDAFGHDQDEDAPFTSPALRLPDRAPPRRTGGMAAVFGIVVADALVFGVVSLIGHASSIHLPNLDAPDGAIPKDTPTGLARHSLLRRGNLAPALRRIEAKVGGRVRLVRVAADRVDVQALVGHRLVQVQEGWYADAPVV